MAALEGIHPMTKVTGFLPIIFSKYGLIKLINNDFQNKINISKIIEGVDRVIIAVENSLAQHLHINSQDKCLDNSCYWGIHDYYE